MHDALFFAGTFFCWRRRATNGKFAPVEKIPVGQHVEISIGSWHDQQIDIAKGVRVSALPRVE